MNIHIDSLTVNGLGPISTLKCQFGDVNLIYGRNEKGKTYLVEYLLSSLFRNAEKTRNLTESGQVVVSGISGEPLAFTPRSKMKLEDHIFKADGDKPVDLARLCVIKGGDLSFLPRGERAVTKEVLKGYLSDQRTLESIIKGISSTVLESSFENGIVYGKAHKGEIKGLYEKHAELQKIDALLEAVDSAFSMGEVKKLEADLERTRQLIAEQDRARRAYAFSLSEKLDEHEMALGQMPASELEEARKMLAAVEGKLESLKAARAEQEASAPKCVHFEWLKAAIEAYEKRPAAAAGKAGPLLAALSVIGMLGAIASAFLGSPYAALGAGLGAILFTILAALQYRIRLRSSGDHAEVARIFQEYEVRFGSRAGSIAALKSTFDRLTPVFYGLEKTRQQVTELEKEIPQLEKALRSRLAQLSGRKAAQGDLEAQLQAVQGKHNTLKKACEDLRLALAATQVVPEDYLSEPVKTVFDPDSLKQYERKEKEIESAISEKVNKLGTLKQRVCDLTGDPIDADWAGVIEHLRDRRDEASQGYKELKSRVGSGIVISQVIGEMRAREDERIARALNSPGMRGPIGALTHAYDGIELDGDELVVYNGVQRYLLGMLSTGAQEQVLLALRIGIASHVLKEQKMFLILDDAFQHSDWERRTWLVDEMAVLAGLGWQVLYFSMDDHIRGLFEERVRPKLGKRYQAFELS